MAAPGRNRRRRAAQIPRNVSKLLRFVACASAVLELYYAPTMKLKSTTSVRGLLFVGALCASTVTSWSQIIELRATLNAAQETPVSTSPATGSAIMLYDLANNQFDLIVSISNMANTLSASHIHEAAPGVAGPVVAGLGGESAYTRNGNNLTATFRDIAYGGDRATLLKGGAYYNAHSAQFPGGEIRGQLIPQPVRLVANLDVAQEQAAFPNVNLSGLNDFGAAVLVYDPVANTLRMRSSLFNFNNTFSNSHLHAGAPGVSGPVRLPLGNNANAGSYSNANGFISGTHDIAVPADFDAVALLSGDLYLNYHSTTFSGGELRGQVRVLEQLPGGTRLANTSVRGFVGPGDQVLIHGFHVSGPAPVRLLITAKGPSLAAFGVTGAVANPVLMLFDSGGRRIATNDDVGTPAAGSELARMPGVPANTSESALVVTLPPGNYTAIITAGTGTGIALLEITDLSLGGMAFPAAN